MSNRSTPTSDSRRISIIGAGLTGTMISVYLARRGHEIDLWERRPDPRTTDLDEGRTINMALSTRGLNALRGIDLEEEARELCIPMYGRMVHDPEGELSFQSYGERDDHINAISRSGLTRLLVDRADAHQRVDLHFEFECDDVDLDAPAPVLEDRHSGERVRPESDLVVGADGAYSAVRTRLQKTGRFDYQQSFLDHGYKELTIPPGPDGDWRFEREALHIWPRHDFMLIALPNPDGSFTATLFLPYDGPKSFASLDSDEAVEQFFEREFPDALPHMPNLTDEFDQNPVGSLVTIRCEPYHHEDDVVLAGDAAHAVVPFYGQGMNASFEDCFVFDQLLDEFDEEFSKVLPAFSQRRKPDADALADLALYNYIEMRSKVADPAFLLRQQLEQRLNDLFPRAWRPLYSMVTFSNMPYAEARERAETQQRFLDWVVPETPARLLAEFKKRVAG